MIHLQKEVQKQKLKPLSSKFIQRPGYFGKRLKNQSITKDRLLQVNLRDTRSSGGEFDPVLLYMSDILIVLLWQLENTKEQL